MIGLFGLGRAPKTFEFKCARCGEVHRGSPSFGYDQPSMVLDVPEDEREARVKIDSDLCVIEPPADEPDGETTYLIRATLSIPIEGAKDPFGWGLWVTQSEESFRRYVETFDQDQSADGSFGWLPVAMPYYRRTPNGAPLETLPCDVLWGEAGERPRLVLHDGDHPLIRDQREGISWDKAVEIAQIVMHGSAEA